MKKKSFMENVNMFMDSFRGIIMIGLGLTLMWCDSVLPEITLGYVPTGMVIMGVFLLIW
jgi:hypothetical protein